MTTEYFSNPASTVAGNRQYRGHMAGAHVEHGVLSFVTTGETLQVKTYFSKILSAVLTWQEDTSVGNTLSAEHLYCDLTIDEDAVQQSVEAAANRMTSRFPASMFAPQPPCPWPSWSSRQRPCCFHNCEDIFPPNDPPTPGGGDVA